MQDDNELEFVIDDTVTPPEQVRAKKFVELVSQGQKPSRAAANAGLSLKVIKSNPEMMKIVETLLSTFHLGKAARIAMVNAGLNKLFLENIDSEEGDKKLALDVGKQILATEGIASSDATQINIDLSNINDLIKKVEEEDAQKSDT